MDIVEKIGNIDFANTARDLLNNWSNRLNSEDFTWERPDSWKNPPTIDIDENIEPLIKRKEFYVYNKNGKPYVVECVICLFERDAEKKIFADYRFGYATVHPKDKFNEELGKKLAYERALSGSNERGQFTKKLNRKINNNNSTFEDEMTYSPSMMLELVRLAMPTIVRNKFVKEYVVETKKDKVYYVDKDILM